MAEVVRRTDQYSPKSSPRGSRSPVVSRQDTTGTLKTTISLGKTPAIVHSGPFYLMKEPPKSELTGATNLMVSYNLEHSYNKFSGRKVKDQLSAFLPNLPGNIDAPGDQDNSSLRSLIEKPPVGGKELLPLTGAQLVGFRLHPGPLPEQYRMMSQQPQRKKHKHKNTSTRWATHQIMNLSSKKMRPMLPMKRNTRSRSVMMKRRNERKRRRRRKRKRSIVPKLHQPTLATQLFPMDPNGSSKGSQL
uniref:Mediator of RNA polymerase II transcription subunit 19 n=1 Tax=Amblyomma maculatum TaxID=34609 RepID=G3MLK0_AMBMU